MWINQVMHVLGYYYCLDKIRITCISDSYVIMAL